MKRLAADQQVRNAARLERFDVVAGDVLPEMHESPEQEAHVACHNLAARATAGDGPGALGRQQPAHECGDRLRLLLVERGLRDLRRAVEALAIRTRHRQRNHRRLLLRVFAVAKQRNVVGLQRFGVAIHVVAERRVHEMLDRRHASKRGLQGDRGRAASGQTIGNAAIRTHVSAAESVDRLLRITDDEQRSRTDRPIVTAGQGKQELGLKWVGILELVDENHPKALAELAADSLVVSNQVPGLDQQVEEVERAGFLFAILVSTQALTHLLVQERGEVGVSLIAKRPQVVQQPGMRGQRLFTRDANRKGSAGALLPDVGKVAILGQANERRLPPVPHPLGHHIADRAALALDVIARNAGRRKRHRKVVVALDRFGDQVC